MMPIPQRRVAFQLPGRGRGLAGVSAFLAGAVAVAAGGRVGLGRAVQQLAEETRQPRIVAEVPGQVLLQPGIGTLVEQPPDLLAQFCLAGSAAGVQVQAA